MTITQVTLTGGVANDIIINGTSGTYNSGDQLTFTGEAPASLNITLTSVVGSSPGNSLIIGHPDYPTVIDCQTTITMGLKSNIYFVGNVTFNDTLTFILPSRTTDTGVTPVIYFGVDNTGVAGSGSGLSPTPLIAHLHSRSDESTEQPLPPFQILGGAKGIVRLSNQGSIMYVHVNKITGGIEHFNVPISSNTGSTNVLYFVIDQEVIDAFQALEPNTYIGGQLDYNLYFTGTTVDRTIAPFSLDEGNLPPSTMRIFAEQDITFEFINTLLDPPEPGVIPFSLFIDVCAGKTVQLRNGIVQATPNNQCLELTGYGTLDLYMIDEDTPSMTLDPDGSVGFVDICNNDIDYGYISGRTAVILTPGDYSGVPVNNLPYGIDPRYVYENSIFTLNTSGTYVLGTFSHQPVRITVGPDANAVVSGSTLGGGVLLDMCGGNLTFVDTVLGSSSVTDASGHYVIDVVDGYSGTVNFSGATLCMTSGMNFINPIVDVSAFDNNTLQAYQGSYSFSNSEEHTKVFGTPIELPSASGVYTLSVLDDVIRVKPTANNITIQDSTVRSQLYIDTNNKAITVAGNVYYDMDQSIDPSFAAPLRIEGTGTVTMSSVSPDTWVMSNNHTHPYIGSFASSSYSFGHIYLVSQWSGTTTYDMSMSSWYGMAGVYTGTSLSNYALNNVWSGNGSRMQITGTTTGIDTRFVEENLTDIYLIINATDGVLLKPDGITFTIVDSNIDAADAAGAIMLPYEASGALRFGTSPWHSGSQSVLTTNSGHAIIYDICGSSGNLTGAVTVTNNSNPILYYTGSPNTYNFGTGYRQLEYDAGIYLANGGDNTEYTFNNMEEALTIRADSEDAVSPIITDSTFDHGIKLVPISSNMTMTLRDTRIVYWTSSESTYLEGEGTVEISAGTIMEISVGHDVDRIIHVGSQGNDDTVSLFVGTDALTIETNSRAYVYGIEAYTTGRSGAAGGTIDIGNLELNAAATRVYWPTLATDYESFPVLASPSKRQPFQSTRRYVAYSYDQTADYVVYRTGSGFYMVDYDGSLNNLDIAVCAGDPSLAHTIPVRATDDIVSSDLTSDPADLPYIFVDPEGYATYYFGALGTGSGSGVKSMSQDASINAGLQKFPFYFATIDAYLGTLHGTITTTTSGDWFTDNVTDASGTLEVFHYTIISPGSGEPGYDEGAPDTVPVLSVARSAYPEGPDANLPNYIGVEANTTAGIKVSLSRPSIAPLYIFPDTGSDNTPFVSGADTYAGYVDTRSLIAYEDKADPSGAYLTYNEYIDASLPLSSLHVIPAGEYDTEFRIEDINDESLFLKGVLPLYAYYSRTRNSSYIAGEISPSAGIVSYTNIMLISNHPGELAYPRISTDGGAHYNSEAYNTIFDSGDNELGSFNQEETYDDSNVYYTVTFYVRSDLEALPDCSHNIVFDWDHEGDFDFAFGSTDPSVSMIYNGDGTYSMRTDTLDLSGHMVTLTVRTNRSLSDYTFNSLQTVVFTITDTSLQIFGSGTPDVSVNTITTQFYMPPTVLVGISTDTGIADGNINAMSYSGELSYNFDRDSNSTQYVTIKTVGSMAYDMSLSYPLDVAYSDAIMNVIYTGSDVLNFTVGPESHSDTVTFEIPALSDDHHALNDGQYYRLTPDAANTYYTVDSTTIHLNGDGDDINIYELETIDRAFMLKDGTDQRYLSASYMVGPQNMESDTLYNYEDGSWYYDDEVIVYPTSRIYPIAVTVCLASIPYQTTYGDDSGLVLNLSIQNSAESTTLTPGVDVSVSFTSDFSDGGNVSSITLDSSNYSGQTLYIRAPNYDYHDITVTFVVASNVTDYSGIDDSAHSLVTISYDGVPTGSIEANRFSLGNWVVESDSSGNLLFKYSVLKDEGENVILGTYVLVPLTGTKFITSTSS